MKTILTKVGIALSIILGVFIPVISCQILWALADRPNITDDYRNKLRDLSGVAFMLGILIGMTLLLGFIITHDPYLIVLPALNWCALLLTLLAWFWDWLTPLAEEVKGAPEDSETLCRPYMPVVPCKMEASVTTNEEAKV